MSSREGAAARNYTVEAVSRAVTLMRAVAESGTLTLNDAAALVDVSKSTAFRLLETLQQEGLIERLPGGGYRPGPESVRWGLLLLRRVDAPAVAADDLRTLWLETGETVVLGLLTGVRIVLAEILESPSPFRMAEVPGAIAPLHCSALGKAIGAQLDPDRLRRAVGPEPFEPVTPNAATTWEELERRLSIARDLGYATEIEESALGVACVASTIYQGEQVVGAISVAGPRVRMSDDRLALLGPRVREAAARISRRLAPQPFSST